MSISEWGTVTWKVFHTLAEKLRDEKQSHVPMLLTQILRICHNLPCPTCKQHAVTTLKKINKKNIKTKLDLIKFLWSFHNMVNVKRKVDTITLEECREIYKKENTSIIVGKFIHIFGLNLKSEHGLNSTFLRQICIKEFKQYVLKNHLNFDK